VFIEFIVLKSVVLAELVVQAAAAEIGVGDEDSDGRFTVSPLKKKLQLNVCSETVQKGS
jgi:hypothetical protein